ncbi:MAG: sugar phosphate nucleotidyltransferase [Brevinematia bacterium]
MKGVIIAAGYGSRFLPITKTIPKEMLPLYNLPSIHFAVQELILSGIKDILILTSRRKKALDDYFDIDFELETFFAGTDKEKLLKPYEINVCFVRQKKMMGVGNALLEVGPFIKDEPFIVIYPDDIIISTPPLSERLINAFNKTSKNVLTLINKEREDLTRFGVVKFKSSIKDYFEIEEIVEKPKGIPPSSYITIGRYLFTPELIYLLKKEWENFEGKGEFYHIDAINALASQGKVIGIEIDKKDFYDTGTPLEYTKSFIRYALEYAEDRDLIREWIVNFIKESL